LDRREDRSPVDLVTVGIGKLFKHGKPAPGCPQKLAVQQGWKTIDLGASQEAKLAGGRLCLAPTDSDARRKQHSGPTRRMGGAAKRFAVSTESRSMEAGKVRRQVFSKRWAKPLPTRKTSSGKLRITSFLNSSVRLHRFFSGFFIRKTTRNRVNCAAAIKTCNRAMMAEAWESKKKGNRVG